MITRASLLAAGLLTLSTPVAASPPLAPERVAAIEAAFSQCTGGWQSGGEWRRAGVGDSAPLIAPLSRASSELDDNAGVDLYRIAKGFLVPAVEVPDWIPDRSSTLKCSPRPADGVAIMQYLVGDAPGELKGYSNALLWLGLAYEQGVLGAPDPGKARRYYLLSRMHGPFPQGERWSDGIDGDLLANIERAGLRPYFDRLLDEPTAGAARMILAEEVLAADPARARSLLRSDYLPALNRLVELEEQGRVPVPSDADDIAFWAKAWSTQFDFEKWAARLLKGASLANGGVLPTAPTRPSIDALRPSLDRASVTDTPAIRRPLPVRALVDPQGRAIYAETCRDTNTPFARRINAEDTAVRLDAVRLYNLAGLPRLTPPAIDGRPAYGWVILPAVQFQRPTPDKLEIAFSDLPAEACRYSDMLFTAPGATPPPF